MTPHSPKDGYTNPPTFDSVYQEWASYVYSMAYRLTGNKADAEDLSQEAFVRVYRFLKGFRGGSLKGWLYKIVMNAFYLKLEKEKKLPRLAEDEVLFLEQIQDDRHYEPSEFLKRKENTKDILSAIAALPTEYKMALVLADLEEMSYQEIARILSVPIGTVRSRISRARFILREKLIQHGEEKEV